MSVASIGLLVWICAIFGIPIVVGFAGVLFYAGVSATLATDLFKPLPSEPLWPQRNIEKELTAFLQNNPGFTALTDPLDESIGSSISTTQQTTSAPLVRTAGESLAHGDIYRIKDRNTTYTLYRVKLPHMTPHIVINSRIDDKDGLANTYVNGSPVYTEGDVNRYFSIITTQHNERIALQILPPDVLWKVLVDLDNCDVELHSGYMDFIWAGEGINSSILKGRVASVQSFIKEILNEVQPDMAGLHPVQLKPDLRDGRKSKLTVSASLKWTVALAWVIALIASFGIWDAKDSLPVIIIASFFLTVPMIAFTLSVVLESWLLILAVRAMIAVVIKIKKARRVRHYTLYYEGRS